MFITKPIRPRAVITTRVFSSLRTILTLSLTFCLSGLAAFADGVVGEQTVTIQAPDETKGLNIRDGSVVVAPIPFSNPTIGSGLALGAGYLFKADPKSKASMIGLGGFRSDNGSEGYGLSLNLFLDDNRWIFKSLFAKADLKYDLFVGGGVKLPIRQEGAFARLSLAYGVTSDLSFGGTLQYLDTQITLNGLGGLIPPPYDRDLGLELLNLGFVTQWDRRDDSVYPTSGSNLVVNLQHGTALGGGDVEYQKAWATYDDYRSLGARSVLASRIATCGTSSGTPFFEQCSLGGTDAFRGFSATEYLNNRLVSVQVEYRHILTDRFGVTVFGGAGAVGATFADLDNTGFHAAGGIGLRYRVSRKFPVDFSIDATRNDQRENLLYIYVGQRF